MKKELECVYNSQKSFWGKATVDNEDGMVVLRSFDSRVAGISEGTVILFMQSFTNTTLKHLKEFLKQHGFRAETQKQILKDYADVR